MTKSVSRRSIVAGAAFGALSISTGLSATVPAYADMAEKFGKFSKGASASVDHAVWDRLLQKYVVVGENGGLNRVRYAAFKTEGHRQLKDYIRQLEGVRLATLDRGEQFAFWANLYNAKTIDIVLDHYPVTSIRNITITGGVFNFLKKSVGAGGPWKAKVVTVGGQRLSLDNIEHDIMRRVFRDPRVHYAVNCASIGCPNLQAQAFTGARLNAMLDKGARDFINDTRGMQIVGDRVQVSSIYKWFVSDFGGSDQGVLSHIRKYAMPKLQKKLAGVTSISDYAYDWRLNDAG